MLQYLVALVCLWLTLRLLYRMVQQQHPSVADHRFTIAAISLVLTSHYLIRDLDDSGRHIIFLTMIVAGVYYVRKGREDSVAG